MRFAREAFFVISNFLTEIIIYLLKFAIQTKIASIMGRLFPLLMQFWFTYTSSQQMLNMMASVISNNNPPILHTGAIQGTKRTSYNDTSKWPINISSGHFMSVSGYNLSNATIQVTDPDVTNQQSSSSYSSGKYYINSSVVYSTCDYFAA